MRTRLTTLQAVQTALGDACLAWTPDADDTSLRRDDRAEVRPRVADPRRRNPSTAPRPPGTAPRAEI